MTPLDKLRMDRRQLEVEIGRLQDKIDALREEKKLIDQKIASLMNENKEFSRVRFG